MVIHTNFDSRNIHVFTSVLYDEYYDSFWMLSFTTERMKTMVMESNNSDKKAVNEALPKRSTMEVVD